MLPQPEVIDISIRVFPATSEGYPAEINRNGIQIADGLLELDIPSGKASSKATGEAGRHLFRWLFPEGELRDKWMELRGRGLPRRIRLHIDADSPELHAVPWELVAGSDEELSQPLSANHTTPFSRYVATGREYAFPVTRPIRVLVAIANPDGLEAYGLPAIDVEQEIATVKAAIGVTDTQVEVLPQPVTAAALEQKLAGGFHLLYLVAHGGLLPDEQNGARPSIMLADRRNRCRPTSAEELAGLYQRCYGDNSLENGSQLRLIYLSSCETARTSPGLAFRSVALALVEAGAPAVLAMQDLLPVVTARAFSLEFLQRLTSHGRVDLAANQARSHLITDDLPGAPNQNGDELAGSAIPVLYMRLVDGHLWYQGGFSRGRGDNGWHDLVDNIRLGVCTPILGPDVYQGLVGSYREIAQNWALESGFPMARHQWDDLPQVAQYVAVMRGDPITRMKLEQHLRQALKENYPAILNGMDGQLSLDEMIVRVGKARQVQNPYDPYSVLAQLPLPIYVTTNPSNLLFETLQQQGKQPRQESCPWRRNPDHLQQATMQNDRYRPSFDAPLVYQLFGNLADMDSFVLTENDYFDYLIGTTSNNEVIPTSVKAALNDTALLFLGFRLEDWAFRVAFRSIMGSQGRTRRNRFKHVAVQINPEQSQITEMSQARHYLEEYLREEEVFVYWGSVDGFLEELGRRALPMAVERT